MFVAKYRSMAEAALQAGNSETIIRRHYLDLKSTEEAERFFGILPQGVRTEGEPDLGSFRFTDARSTERPIRTS